MTMKIGGNAVLFPFCSQEKLYYKNYSNKYIFYLYKVTKIRRRISKNVSSGSAVLGLFLRSLESLVRILLRIWMPISRVCDDRLITSSEESYWICVCVCVCVCAGESNCC